MGTRINYKYIHTYTRNTQLKGGISKELVKKKWRIKEWNDCAVVVTVAGQFLWIAGNGASDSRQRIVIGNGTGQTRNARPGRTRMDSSSQPHQSDAAGLHNNTTGWAEQQLKQVEWISGEELE